MPLQPGPLTEPLVSSILDMYGAAEAELLGKIAARISKGAGAPGWAERQLLETQRFRAEAEQVLAKLQAQTPAAAKTATNLAMNRGAAQAHADLAKALTPAISGAPRSVGHTIDTFALTAAANDLTRKLDATRPQIYRSVDDAYRQVIARATAPAMLGAITQREAVDRALADFAKQGITGFTDRAGRRWELQSYVDMATRSALMNAAAEGHTARLAADGFDLVIVSDVPQECERCRPLEGQVLSLTGKPTDAAWANGKPVRVWGTMSQARSAGLYHPGCRHSHTLWTPRTRSFGETADPQGQKDREKLRYLERQVRAAKRQQAVATTPEAKKAANAAVKGWQAKIRDHTASTSAKRQPWREQVRGPAKSTGPATPKPTTPKPTPSKKTGVAAKIAAKTKALVFATARKGREWAAKHWPRKDQYPTDVADEVATYSTSSGYQTINGALRQIKGEITKLRDHALTLLMFDGTPMPGVSNLSMQQRIERMDKAMAIAPAVPEAVTVVRGTRWQEFQALGINSQYDDLTQLVGKVWRNDSYTSTSLGPEAAMDNMPVQMVIEVPKGARAVHMAGDEGYRGALSTIPTEEEFLLARGTRFVVTRVVKVPGTTSTNHTWKMWVRAIV